MSGHVVQKYRNDFLKEVEAIAVEMGDWVKMCMQCGVCSGSCPLGAAGHPPQEIFAMIRAGKRDLEVLKSESMWMCTSSFNCIVRCPRKFPSPISCTGWRDYAYRLGLAPKMNQRATCRCCSRAVNRGRRVNELSLSVGLYFMNGFVRA